MTNGIRWKDHVHAQFQCLASDIRSIKSVSGVKICVNWVKPRLALAQTFRLGSRCGKPAFKHCLSRL